MQEAPSINSGLQSDIAACCHSVAVQPLMIRLTLNIRMLLGVMTLQSDSSMPLEHCT